MCPVFAERFLFDVPHTQTQAIVRMLVALQTLAHAMMIIILPKLLLMATGGNAGQAGALQG